MSPCYHDSADPEGLVVLLENLLFILGVVRDDNNVSVQPELDALALKFPEYVYDINVIVPIFSGYIENNVAVADGRHHRIALD